MKYSVYFITALVLCSLLMSSPAKAITAQSLYKCGLYASSMNSTPMNNLGVSLLQLVSLSQELTHNKQEYERLWLDEYMEVQANKEQVPEYQVAQNLWDSHACRLKITSS